jgi:hypothetical protein
MADLLDPLPKDKRGPIIDQMFGLNRPSGDIYEIFGPHYTLPGYPLKVGQLEYDCRYSKMYGMPVAGGRGFSALKPLWNKGVPP